MAKLSILCILHTFDQQHFSFYKCLHFENIDFPILCEIQTGLQTDDLSDLLNNQILLSSTVTGFFYFYIISKKLQSLLYTMAQ
jgi:hypothetical protein